MTSRNVAYRRVSTEGQNFHRQLADLSITFDAEFSDKLSGKDTNRPALAECLEYLQKGDCLIIHEISRLARDVEDLRNIVFGLMEKGVTVKFMKEGLEFTGDDKEPMKVAMSKMLLTLLGSVAEFERALINGRIVEGVAQAKKRGVQFGGKNKKWQESFKANKALGLHKKSKSSEVAKTRNAPIVAEVKNMVKYSKDSLTLSEIACNLNDKSMFTSTGGLWSKASVSRLVRQNEIQYQPKNRLTK